MDFAPLSFFLSFFSYLFSSVQSCPPAEIFVGGGFLRQRIVTIARQLETQKTGLRKTITSVQASPLFLQLFCTGAGTECIFWKLGGKKKHLPALSPPFQSQLECPQNKSHWSKRTRLVAETFYFAVDYHAIFVVSQVSLSGAIFEG